MDLGLTPTSTISADDTETDTPPHTHNQPINLFSFSNGAFQHYRPKPPHAAAAYKECMKNYAAAIAGHAVDGCGEFMSSDHADPTSLKCAACGCHRNFHRRESGALSTPIAPQFINFRRPSLPKRSSLSTSPPPPPILYPPHGLLTLRTAVAAEDDHYQAPVTPIGENPVGRKRSRTKFSQEQKEKMQSFSEKLGWRMQRSDEASVEEFCNEIGVKKGLLKVWMRNNKNTIGKKQTRNGIVNGGIIDFENNGGSRKTDNGSQLSGGVIPFHGSNNGSCS